MASHASASADEPRDSPSEARAGVSPAAAFAGESRDHPSRPAVAGAGPLVERHVGFLGALRDAGVPVSLAEGLDAARALAVIDVADRWAFREAYAATLVKRASHRPAFDTLFDLWFPAAVGDGTPYRIAGHGERGRDRDRDRDVAAMRDELAELLLSGDEAALAGFAREAVRLFGRAPAERGRQAWFSYDVMRELSPETLMSRLLAEVLTGQERGGLAERVARQRLGARMRRFEDLVGTEVRRRIAEDSGIEKIARTAVKPPLEQVDFLRATRADLARLRREVQPLARRLAARLRIKHGARGRLDFRRTVRASLSTGGVPVVTHHRPRRPHRPELVILCDASDSVSSFAHFTLLLTFALREQFSKVRAFAFIDTVDEITRFFAPGADVVDAMTRMTREADLVWITGHSNYGNAFKVFEERYGDAVGPRTSLLVLGDARSNYSELSLPVVRRLADAARGAYWLNPEPRRDWDTGDSAATPYGEIIPMHECRNVRQLSGFIEEIG
nr:VWA domain-containing protein [Bailinhaonella thermotolerans]